VPWGLADWWNFGGLIRPVWLEATYPVHVVRADALRTTIETSAAEAEVRVAVEIHRAAVTAENLLDPAPAALMPAGPPIARHEFDPSTIRGEEVIRIDAGFLLADAPAWSPRTPGLHLARVTVSVGNRLVDEIHETFGLRQVAVDTVRPAVVLNGNPVALPGVALHDQYVSPDASGRIAGGVPSVDQIREQVEQALSVGARLVRSGHAPADPALLDLADRLGLAVWEEIPLYHFTPQTFAVAMRRGIPQQMLREMALRDMNRPSVLFHGLANESTGDDERAAALGELNEIDKTIDGTRLTGQAAYGFNPSDTTSSVLDVSGWTMYHGVFYGSDPRADTAAALETAHATLPDKPIVVLEFGRWADSSAEEAEQRRILDETASAILPRRATDPSGFVSAAVWWTLQDYATLRPNLEIEHFGLFRPDGSPRAAASVARDAFERLPNGLAVPGRPEAPAAHGAATVGARPIGVLVGYVGYGLAVGLGVLMLALGLLVFTGGHSRAAIRRARRMRRRSRRRPVAPAAPP
jgi:beta-galactosidase